MRKEEVCPKLPGSVNVGYFISALQSCVIKTVGVLEWLTELLWSERH